MGMTVKQKAKEALRKSDSALSDVGYLKFELADTKVKLEKAHRRLDNKSTSFIILGLIMIVTALTMDFVCMKMSWQYAIGFGGFQKNLFVMGLAMLVWGLS